MAKKLKDLTKKEWSRIKKAAGIESNKKLFKSDASVGKHVAAFEKARKKVEGAKTEKNVAAYLKAMDSLEDAFTKFLKAKDLSKDEGKALEKEMKDWIKQLKDTRNAFVKHLKEGGMADLKKASEDELNKQLDQFIL